jgi:OmpA-OmpF porin, OOP family
MKTTPLRLLPLLIVLSLPLAACKKNAEPSPAPGSATPATPASSTASAGSAPAATPSASTDTNAAPPKGARPAIAEIPFDFTTVPEAVGTIPPFPYVDYPPKVQSGGRWTTEVPMDRVYVILGDHLHALDGRVMTRKFAHRDAEMSELEVRRNYENAIRAIGAVKVNTVQPENPAIVAAVGGDDYFLRKSMLMIPDLRMSYDVYLARRGDVRHWIVVTTNDSETGLLTVEEKPFAQTVGFEGSRDTPVAANGAPAAAAQPLDIASLPVSTAALPPFPYLAYPPGLHQGSQFTQHANFDAVSIIVGKELRSVEGEVETRTFPIKDANMSAWAVRRNYEAAIKALGGVKVNAVGPDDKALLAAHTGKDQSGKEVTQYSLHKDKMRYADHTMSYDSYLVRTPDANVWLVLMFNDSETRLLAVREKAMQQSVALVTADAMRKELDAKGKVALYINFDTDKASIRPDGKPAVDEITKLLTTDPALKLAIEGHTDNSGDGAHNLALSKARADAVLQTLVKDGIDAKRLRTAGHGAGKPLADNKDEAGRAKNRRVELIKL